MKPKTAGHQDLPNQLPNALRRRARLWLCAGALVCLSSTGFADSDHDRARHALQAGEVLPLGTILERVEREVPGKILDVELDRDKDDGLVRWVYKVKVLSADGTLLKLKVDGKSGALISRKRKDLHGAANLSDTIYTFF